MSIPAPQEPVTDASLRLRQELVEVIRFFHDQGWASATSSNFSCRHSETAAPKTFWVSASGFDKGGITAGDFVEMDLEGRLVEAAPGLKPSAETRLHEMIYRRYPKAAAILHTHSVNATVLSLLAESDGRVVFQGFEMLKAFRGVATHEVRMLAPVFSNAQDMSALVETIETRLDNDAPEPLYGFLLAGHGLYTWGETIAEARRHAEAFEFLMACHLQLRSYGDPVYTG